MKESYVAMKAQMFNYEQWIEEVDPDILKDKLGELLLASGFTVLNHMEHYFPVQGYTCVWLLGESHLAVHTFPQSKRSFIQLSSCNEEKSDLLKERLPSVLSPVDN